MSTTNTWTPAKPSATSTATSNPSSKTPRNVDGERDAQTTPSKTTSTSKGNYGHADDVPVKAPGNQPAVGSTITNFYRILELGIPQAQSTSTDVYIGGRGQTGSKNTSDNSKCLATLLKSDFETTETTLAAVRTKLAQSTGSSVLPGQRFRYVDGSPAADSMTISAYIEIGNKINTGHGANVIYINPPVGDTSARFLSQPPFVIDIFQWSVSPNDPNAIPTTTSKGSVHSKSIADPTRSAAMTLAGLRKLVPGMSSFPSVHKFCTTLGSTVENEQLNLAEYLAQMPAASYDNLSSTTGPSAIPSIKVYYKTNQAFNNPSKLEVPPEIKANTTLTATPPGKTADRYMEKSRTSMLNDSSFTSGADTEYGASYLDDEQWSKVLTNCGVFYGWVVDRRTNRIVRAPKAAFQLRSKVLEDPICQIPDYLASQLPPAAQPNESITVETSDTQTSDDLALFKTDYPELADSIDSVVESVRGSQGSEPMKQPNDALEQFKIQHPDLIDRIDAAISTTRAVQASELAIPAALPTAPPAADVEIISPPPVIPRTKTDKGIPNFRVNDDSRIDITACEHEFEVSMARNDFSSQSTEASMSGGFAGFSVSVSAGYSSSRQDLSKSTHNEFKKTLVARYLFPRCDLFLYADDLEPSPDLAAAIERVKTTRNIKDLRKIHADYGHLFCQNLTLGGRLQSTKIINTTTDTSEQEHKEQFKASVGVSVSTPFGASASMKHESEEGHSEGINTMNKSTNENNVFEAVGGDTILANNPAEWAPTVGKHQFWRVINRDALASLADVLAAIPGYTEVKSYFVQAIPAVSKFIELDEGHQVMTRLRLLDPLIGLSLRETRDPAYYLGHIPALSTTPRMMSVDERSFWGHMIEHKEEIPLFNPRSIRAPVLVGYSESKVGGSQFGAAYNQEYTETEWRMIAPFNEALTHGARVILCTNPYNDPVSKDALSAPPPKAPAHMVVFRNQQGAFLPGMSESDENQFWRILKKGCQTIGEHIKEGDEVRLCWAFSDQVTGFRDYTDDIFGRRRNQCPPELENSVLYLKLPWPRFETQNPIFAGAPPPNSMVMAPVESTEPRLIGLKTLPANGGRFNYVVQDVSFRIDTVANDGLGDTDDYLMRNVVQEGANVSHTIKVGGETIFNSSFRGLRDVSRAFFF